MRYLDFKAKIKTNIFSILDAQKHFPKDDAATIKIQLSRFATRGLITNLKRGLYCFDIKAVDEFVLAHLLYQPSYISAESALHYYGIIPDIPQAVTSITVTTSKRIKSSLGLFLYSKVKRELFFGYNTISSPGSTHSFFIAQKEKALLDYLYLRKIKDIRDARLHIDDFNWSRYRAMSKLFPLWVQAVKI